MMSLGRLIQLLSVVTVVMSTEFASQLRKCRVNDKVALNSCLRRTLEDLRPRLQTGIPELGLPPLEPMRINNLIFRQGDGAVTIEASFSDVTVSGLSRYNVSYINADPVKQNLRVGLFVPQLRIIGNYNLNGQIIILAINGNGPFRCNLNGVDVSGLSQVGIIRSPSGAEQIRISGTNVDVNIQRLTMRLENLFNGDPILGETVNHFLNENGLEIFREIKPEVTRQLSILVEQVMNDALSQLPVDSFLVGSNQG